MRRVAVLVGLGWALASSRPGSAETLRLDGVFAARAREASLLPTVGIDAFSGPAGDELGAAIQRRLAAVDAEGVPHARIVTPSLRPDGLLAGTTDIAVRDESYTETRRRCVEKKARECVRHETYRVRCMRRSVGLRAVLRLTRAEDRRIVYAAAKTRDADDSGCEDGADVPSIASSLDGMVESIAREVRLDLALHRDRYAVRIREERVGLSRGDADRFRAAVRLTKRDQPAACRAFAAIGLSAPDHGPTLFNRALCAEADGRYRESGDLYARARVFADGNGGGVSKGLDRVASLQAGSDDLRRMTASRMSMP